MKTIASDKLTVIAGMGLTGYSCARFLASKGKRFVVMDSRELPPKLSAFQREFPDCHLHTGSWDVEILKAANEILLSPGVPLATKEIQQAQAGGVEVRGDIDLFVEQAKAPVVAITGSNGKSTVTTLLGEMAKANGTHVAIGGNLGTPALDLLADEVELYILELSSFQLETTSRLGADVVTLLNISEDHMDRYPDKLSYLRAKQRIFLGAKTVVVNDDEVLSSPMVANEMSLIHFGLESQDLGKFSIQSSDEGALLVKGFDVLIAEREVALKGRHNLSNALAALALGAAAGLRMEPMLTVLKTFKGLPHRCQTVAVKNGVTYINDSKGTNVGAALVAIESFGRASAGKIILIAGGEAKGADVSGLAPAMQNYGRAAVLIGRDADYIERVLEHTPTHREGSMHDAVAKACALATDGDTVLLSPACASFDMYQDYQARGDDFEQEVLAL